jgi:hypothetical protein
LFPKRSCANILTGTVQFTTNNKKRFPDSGSRFFFDVGRLLFG